MTDALRLRFKAGDTPHTVSGETVRRLAHALGFSESQVVHYAVARLRDELIPAYPADAPELSDQAMQTIRTGADQDGYRPTRCLFPGV